MSKYTIHLTPLGKFFFGRDKTFSPQDSNKYSKKPSQLYYAKSALFPQQTSILGMIRYSIAKTLNFKNTGDWIGETSFNSNNENGYGVIKSISEVYIQGETRLTVAGFNCQTYNDLNLIEEIGKPIKLDKFDDKEDFSLVFKDKNGTKISSDQVFKKHFQVGINTGNRKGKTQDEGFYKQDSYMFIRDKIDYSSKFKFAFDVDFQKINLGDFDALKLNNQIVNLGSESHFLLNIVPYVNSEQIQNNGNIIILQSDTFIEDMNELIKNSEFILSGDLEPFKYINGKENSKSHYSKPIKSEQYFLLPRGTVIYSNNPLDNLFNIKGFQNIGMNKYIKK